MKGPNIGFFGKGGPFGGQAGKWASFFPAAYHVVQSDLGLSYGAVMRPTAGNTSGVAFALTGATPAVPVPIWIKITAPGVGAIYYDGLGVTPAMSGVTVTDSVQIILTGAGAGMGIMPGVGSQVAGDTWKATCSSLKDQTANNRNVTADSIAGQPIITAGLNGKVGLLFDGVANRLSSLAHALITALPFQAIVIGRFVGPVNGQAFIGTDGFVGPTIHCPSANTVQGYNGSNGLSLPFSSNAPTRFSVTDTGSTSDVFLAGDLSRTGVNAGSFLPNTANHISYGAWDALATFANVELFAVILTPPAALAAFDAALNAPGGYGTNAIAGGTLVPASWASFFPGAYQVAQTDMGLTYGTAMAVTAGNTSTATMTIGGVVTPTVPKPLWIKLTGTGTTANIYYDGTGLFPAMTGVAVTAGVPIALTGALAGTTITPSAGTLVLNDTWKATCAGLADQSGNAKHYTQATAALQPLITAGLNGKPGLLFDGVNDYLNSTAGTLFSTSYLVLVVGRITGSAVNANAIVAGGTPTTVYAGVIYESAGGSFSMYSGSVGPTIAFTATTNQRWAAKFTGTAGDTLKIGALTATAVGSGGGVGSTRNIGATADPGQYSKCEIFAVLYVPVASDYSAFDAALNTLAGYGPGTIAV